MIANSWIRTLFVAFMAIFAVNAESQAPASSSAQEEILGPVPEKAGWRCIIDNGRHIAYVGERNGRSFIAVDGKEIAEHDSIEMASIAFSDSGERTAYAVRKGKKVALLVDGKVGAEYDDVLRCVFSPDGRRLAYVAQKGRKSIVVVDGVEGKEYFQVLPVSLSFSPDGKRVAYSARPASALSNPRGLWTLVVDGTEGSKHDFVVGPYFSRDGMHVAYAATKYRGGSSTKMSVVVDGKNGPEFDEVGLGKFGALLGKNPKTPPVFSSNGMRIAYLARKGAKWSVIVDGKQGPEYDGADYVSFSPDGEHLAFGAKVGTKWSMIADGKEGPQYDDIGDPVFSPDGKRIGYGAIKDKKFFVVMDGQEGTAYDEVGYPVFSPDGKRIAHQAKKALKWIMVVDGREGQEYDEIIGNGCSFRADGTTEYLAVKDKVLYRVKS